jgi:hypothetical protein
VTAKLRASYGRATRPPSPGLKEARTLQQFGYGQSTITDYANFNMNRANDALGPEYQRGGEGGVELYFGTSGSLVVTRYNQTVDELIDAIRVDSMRSVTPNPSSSYSGVLDPAGYGYWPQFQNLNIASIRNQGWELQGSVNLGPLTTKGTYSWTKSRTIGVNPQYYALLTGARYRPGATFSYLPEHTWAVGLTYARAGTTMSLNTTGTGRVMNFFDDRYYQVLDSRIRLLPDRQNTTSGSLYVSTNRAYLLADMTMSHRLSPRLEGVLQAQNITDQYKNDYWAAHATMGRQVKLGARMRL